MNMMDQLYQKYNFLDRKQGPKTIDISYAEAVVILAIYDRGFELLQDADVRNNLDRIVNKLKDEIWP